MLVALQVAGFLHRRSTAWALLQPAFPRSRFLRGCQRSLLGAGRWSVPALCGAPYPRALGQW